MRRRLRIRKRLRIERQTRRRKSRISVNALPPEQVSVQEATQVKEVASVLSQLRGIYRRLLRTSALQSAAEQAVFEPGLRGKDFVLSCQP